MNPFSSIAARMVERGYSVIPLIPGGKAPGQFRNGEWSEMPKWDQFANRRPTEIEVEYWANLPGAGVGVVLGPVSGIIALDFDYDVDGKHEIIRQLIPDSPVKKVGAKGFTAFYKYSGEGNHNWKINGQSVLELLSAKGTETPDGGVKYHGRQTVLPPSLHPDGMAYKWITRWTLLDCDDLPALPPDFIHKMDALFGRNQPIVRPVSDLNLEFGDVTHAQVEKALQFVSADGDYHTWVEIGMAIKTEFGDGGFDLWDQWSSRGGKYNAKEMASKWRSFRRNDKKIASVFYFAQQGGYIHVPEYVNNNGPALGVRIEAGGNLHFLGNFSSITITSEKMEDDKIELKQEQMGSPSLSAFSETSRTKKKRTLSEINDPALLKAPGTLGEIVNWINDTAIYPSPWLAMAAAISLMGVVKGHRVGLKHGLRTNVYTMGVAGSGVGKEHARKCIDQLLLLSGQSLLLGGTPKSDAGLYNAVKVGEGRRLLQLDEFGKVLATMTSKGAAGHLVGIPTLMMQLFSSANSNFLGAEYSNHDGKRGRTDIAQPCLCVHATTVPGRLYEAMSSSDAVDGFLSRWLIFETKEFVLDESPGGSIESPPPTILDALEYWKEQPTNVNPMGNLDAVNGIRPKVIEFTPEADRFMLAFRREMRLKMKDHADRNTGMDAIYARTAEHAAKLALIAYEGGAIGADVFDWAAQMAWSRSEYLAMAVKEHVADNQTEAEAKKVMKLITEAGDKGMSQSDLTRKTQFLPKKRRMDVIQDLVDSGLVESISEPPTELGGRPKMIFKIK